MLLDVDIDDESLNGSIGALRISQFDFDDDCEGVDPNSERCRL